MIQGIFWLSGKESAWNAGIVSEVIPPLDLGNPQEEIVETHSSILAQEILMIEEPRWAYSQWGGRELDTTE